MLTAATSIRPAIAAEWAALVNAPADAPSQGTTPAAATYVPADTVVPSNAVHDVPIEVAVTTKSTNVQTWSGVLPTGERWTLDLSHIYRRVLSARKRWWSKHGSQWLLHRFASRRFRL